MKPALAVLLLAAAARADSLHVPADFASIQAAVDAAQAGDEVVVAAGTYEETVALVDREDITLRGQGKVVLHGGNSETAVVTLSLCTGVRVERLRFEQPAFAAVEVVTSTGTTLSRCCVDGSGGDGLSLVDCTLSVVERCEVEDPAGVGVEVVGCTDTLVFRCRVERPGEVAIDIAGGDVSHVERCTLLDSPSFALLLESPHGTVLDNLIKTAVNGGIDVSGAFADVRDNRLIAAGDVPVRVESFGASSTVEDNRIVKPVDTGLLVQAVNVVVRRNRVIKSEASGIGLFADDPLVTDNVVLHAVNTGFLTGTVTAGTLSGNRALHCGDSGFLIGGSGLLVHGNEAKGSGLDGFFVVEGPHVFTYNLAKGSGLFDLQDSSGAANVYVGNTFPTIEP